MHARVKETGVQAEEAFTDHIYTQAVKLAIRDWNLFSR